MWFTKVQINLFKYLFLCFASKLIFLFENFDFFILKILQKNKYYFFYQFLIEINLCFKDIYVLNKRKSGKKAQTVGFV